MSQSGGLSGDIINAGTRRGVRFSKVLSVGNAIDVTPAEVLEWLVGDPDTAVIGLYLEGAAGADRLLGALRRARREKPVVLLVGGQSTQGAEAVASHTGALTGERRVWEAIVRSAGVALVHTLEEFLAVAAYLQRWQGRSRAVTYSVVGVGGGASVLATDACDRAGLNLEPTTPGVRAMLREMGLGAGTSVANPLEIPFGPVSPVDGLRTVLTPLLRDQPYPDVLVHVNVSAYYGYGTEGVAPLVAQLADLASAPLGDARLGVVLRNLMSRPGTTPRHSPPRRQTSAWSRFRHSTRPPSPSRHWRNERPPIPRPGRDRGSRSDAVFEELGREHPHARVARRRRRRRRRGSHVARRRRSRVSPGG